MGDNLWADIWVNLWADMRIIYGQIWGQSLGRYEDNLWVDVVIICRDLLILPYTNSIKNKTPINVFVFASIDIFGFLSDIEM